MFPDTAYPPIYTAATISPALLAEKDSDFKTLQTCAFACPHIPTSHLLVVCDIRPDEAPQDRKSPGQTGLPKIHDGLRDGQNRFSSTACHHRKDIDL